MKASGLFLSALFVSAIFAGCSSNDEVLEDVKGTKTSKSDSYIAINIVEPDGVSSRGTEGDFEAASEAEKAVNNALFVFFDENDNFIQAVRKTDFNWTDNETTTESVHRESDALIVLTNPKAQPRKVVALINTDYDTETSICGYTSPTLKQLQAYNKDYSSTTNGFAMSNSVYEDESGKEVLAAPLTDENVCSSEDAAKNNPVTIVVERVLAKVSAKVASTGFTNDGTEVNLDNNDVTLVPEITGFKLVATNPKSYIFKNIEDNDNWWTGWNSPANYRSYWANSAAPTNGYTYYTYEDMEEVSGYSEYCLENTSATKTKLLVSATLKQSGATEGETILKYKGLYYTVTGLKNMLINNYLSGYSYSTTNGTSSDWKPYLEIVSTNNESEPWEVKIQLTDDAPSVEDVSTIVDAWQTAMQWTDGQCYYYVDIEHFGTDDQAVGVVRNHSYELTINGITGLGTPVFDPTEEIIPTTPNEETFYVAATMKVLKWKKVTQSVTLE